MKPQALGTTSAAQALPVQTQIVTAGTEVSGPLPSIVPPPEPARLHSPDALRGGGGGRDAMAESLPLEILTYILSFLPLSDQKEASLVNRAWYYAAQNALREPSRAWASGAFPASA
ncbi:hypothetical protein HJG60_009240 [Phyllostomus discolor]|uniref:F-box domain-containing protein n=1 Tax=Phyllostomus discolor TaxID=89673 RepID=A0A833YQ55_9CHIR|nr:hypothetical protein HJG60_009240 [Phyllostomus discolor]